MINNAKRIIVLKTRVPALQFHLTNENSDINMQISQPYLRDHQKSTGVLLTE